MSSGIFQFISMGEQDWMFNSTNIRFFDPFTYSREYIGGYYESENKLNLDVTVSEVQKELDQRYLFARRCQICDEHVQSILLINCGHTILCYTCLDAIKMRDNECPICRVKIKEIAEDIISSDDYINVREYHKLIKYDRVLVRDELQQKKFQEETERQNNEIKKREKECKKMFKRSERKKMKVEFCGRQRQQNRMNKMNKRFR